ncbi:MAG: cytosine permease [Planctomycetes bacterium]|nr:cytosine permease [Planctomycetota bacterium]
MASNLPDYVASAQPVPAGNRVPWYSSTAQTYAGIMLWFVFWQDVPTGGGAPGGTLSQGLGIALVALVVAALLCHFLYYLVPGMLGMKTGLPLYIVGTSTYGVIGGFLMPGFLMGLLQFGWLGVNACFSAAFLVKPFYPDKTLMQVISTPPHIVVAILWAAAGAFMGLKGIQYVAKVATFLPLIPLVILIVLFLASVGGVASFDPNAPIAAAEVGVPLTTWGVFAIVLTYVIGFFATAGAAGTDFGMNNRDAKDVQLGGLVGIAAATIFAGGLALLIVAGTHGLGKASIGSMMNPTELMYDLFGTKTGAVFMYLLAIAAFPPACFSAFIAANSFKTTLPKINPFVTVGLGTIVSIVLAATGWAAQVVDVFQVIGASFGPVCGAMAADYLLAGKKWAGPRSGFNPAGWISWIVGFAVGAFNLVTGWFEATQQFSGIVPIPPLAAFIVGFVLYYVLAKAGMQSKTLEMPSAKTAAA